MTIGNGASSGTISHGQLFGLCSGRCVPGIAKSQRLIRYGKGDKTVRIDIGSAAVVILTRRTRILGFGSIRAVNHSAASQSRSVDDDDGGGYRKEAHAEDEEDRSKVHHISFTQKESP
jgi:hypothetical protein